MEKHKEDIKAIKEMMEKSSKFLSLSGLSGVLAGITAIAGAAFTYFYLSPKSALDNYDTTGNIITNQDIIVLSLVAIVVLFLSIGFALYFSNKKAKKNNQKLFNKVTLRTIYNLSIPLLAGGIIAIIMLVRGQAAMVASTTLVFYGLALINASKFTYEEVHYLGITEVILGILAGIFLYKGLLFWTIGFGVCHIVYGAIMYKKYDSK